MSIRLVTYDLEDPSLKNKLPEFLKETFGARMLTKSSYIMATDKTKEDIVDAIKKLTGKEIHVYVMDVSGAEGFSADGVNRYESWERELLQAVAGPI